MSSLEIDIRCKTPENWDENLTKSPYASIHQTSYYAKHCEDLGEKVYFLSLKRDGEVFAQNLVHVQCASSYVSTELLGLRPFSFKIPPTWLSFEYGPIFRGINDQYIHSFVKLILKTFRSVPVLQALPHPLARDQPETFRRLGFEVTPSTTYLIDLTLDIEQLWKNIRRKTRGNVKRAIKRGVCVEIADSVSDFNEYFWLLNESRKRRKMRSANYDVKKEVDMWRKGISRDVMRLFVAKYKGRITAGSLIPFFNGYLNEWGVAQSTFDKSNRLYSTDLIKWKIIEWGHYSGQRYYDLTLAEESGGVAFFKRKWGGRRIDLHVYSNLSKKGGLVNFLGSLRDMIL